MATKRIPLVGTYNTRGIDGDATLTINEDQRFLNCTFNLVDNPVTGKATIFVEKRPGWGVDSVVAAGSASTGLIKPVSFNASITAFGETNSIIYFGTTSVGVITGRALHFRETLVSNIAHVMIKSSDGTGWYYVAGAKDVTAYTADGNNSTTITDVKIAGVTNTAGLYPGQKLTAGANIVAGTRVVSVDAAAFTAVLDTATTGGAFNDLAITKEPIAKITSANFRTTGTYISAFAPVGGYLFYSTDDGYVNNSDLNSVTAYSPNSRLAVQQSPDPAVAVAVQKNILIVFGQASNEKFRNSGVSSSGSPLQVAQEAVEHIGALDQRSVTEIEDDIYYVSTPYEGDIGVYRMRGVASTRISPPNVDRIMGTVTSGNGAIYASSFRLGGYPYATFFMSLASDGPASELLLESGDILLLEATPGGSMLLEDLSAQVAAFARLMVYNAGLNIWSEWDATEATFIEGVGSGSSNQIVATSRVETGGKIYKIDPVSDGALYRDDGTSYSMQIRTSRLDMGTGKRKFVEEIRLICDRQASGTVTIEASDDDYASWFTLGDFDLTQMEPKVTFCGSHVGGRAYRLTHSANTAFRGEALEFVYTVGL